MTPPPPRHVFMTADAVGGVWTYACDLVRELAQAGVRTTLAVLGPGPNAAQKRTALAAPAVRIVETGLPLDWLVSDPDSLTAAGRRLSIMASESCADLVHLNSPILAAGVRFEQPLVGACHSCLATWWDAVRGGPLPHDFAWKTEVLARGYAACDALIAPSFSFMQATAARYGLVPQVVRNGRAGQPERPATARQPLVFASGRFWDEAKNIRALDAAAARMRRGKVHAAGPLAYAHATAPTLQAVRPLGPLSAEGVAEWLGRATVFASLALYEPFGLGVLEAAQAGCALVLSDIPTHRELWEGSAVFVNPGDPGAVAAVLDDLLAEADEAARLGALARNRSNALTAAAMAEGTLTLYGKLLARHPTLREAAA